MSLSPGIGIGSPWWRERFSRLVKALGWIDNTDDYITDETGDIIYFNDGSY